MAAEYTAAAVAAPILVATLELAVLRTGLLSEGRYWVTLAIALAFQLPVDGWLTRAGHPIVLYSPQATCGVRFPWNIPVEDYGFGMALITLSLLLWRRQADRRTDG
ncbi:lycopene cyclase domain-containing protein [Hamadaea tsunoensis]|uniref:lycopene cyclase domain-containing protein n=1 Tax=Hamadaea tsunoensis TaxID=53368 RepID=UPI000412112B|nr:lycopene cyclase domain-containing protein [Hamadaea tsunoensis]